MADPNSIPISSVARRLICEYPLLKIRKDMGFNEYYEYIKAWNTFNTVWSYNYTVSTLNSLSRTGTTGTVTGTGTTGTTGTGTTGTGTTGTGTTGTGTTGTGTTGTTGTVTGTTGTTGTVSTGTVGTVITSTGTGSTSANLSYYQFPNGYSFALYSNGQLAHMSVYPEAAAKCVFNNII